MTGPARLPLIVPVLIAAGLWAIMIGVALGVFALKLSGRG